MRRRILAESEGDSARLGIGIDFGTTHSSVALYDGGSITRSFEVHAWTDPDLPGRLFRSVKRWLGSASVERVRGVARLLRRRGGR
jgi:molecular chaperone DnaK (HSP70)